MLSDMPDTHLPHSDPENSKEETRTFLRNAYAVRLAFDLLTQDTTPLSRVVEHVHIALGSCRRDVTFEWDLPPLIEKLPTKNPELKELLERYQEKMDDLVIPLIPIRKGRILSKFDIQNSDGTAVYLCDRHEAKSYTKRLLTAAWTQFEDSLTVAPTDVQRKELSACGSDYIKIAELDASAAKDTLADVAQRVHNLNLRFTDDGRRRVLHLGRYFAKRYVFWLRLNAKPGTRVRLDFSYRHRFAADYEPKQISNFFGLLSWVKQFIGQEPSRHVVPISFHGLTRGYHFELEVPQDCYVTSQHFMLEGDRNRRRVRQRASFDAHAKSYGASIAGEDESGGSFSHLYAHNLPSVVRKQVYASVHVAERPPGTTAIVLWLSVFAALSAVMLTRLWNALAATDLQGIDIAALFVALPGLAAAWFARVFQHEGRYRVPFVSRAGLAITGLATAYLVVAVLLRRSVCAPNKSTGAFGEFCTTGFQQVSSAPLLAVVTWVLLSTTLLLTAMRVGMHMRYRLHQSKIVGRYGR
ncbi:hypothetical protein SAMN05421507_119122 [Lentzea jiangxiensis]|uniref:Uncharacterized protein n=2 Tax=Lentzea jiangxiensis TaxID=641025 RepID=A0A1H0WHX8_9PSEU|nr:hypothetical protein SAMN05421507_119122 [Lentzea jiangxiensis]